MLYTVKRFRMKKWIAVILLLLIIFFTLIIVLSPYGTHKGFSYKLVKYSIVINTPVDSVFTFLGNSRNAARWSVFVDHITPLNADKIIDGKPGSIRRCFCQSNEKGMQWDEIVTEVMPNKKRQLFIYNLKNFPVTANNIATEQLYDSVNSNTCKLTFTVFFQNTKPTVIEKIKMYVVAYKIENILKRNLKNIKKLTEKNG